MNATSESEGIVLVTGATGFVGTNLCQRLLKEGLKVRASVRQKPQDPIKDVEYVIINSIDGETNWSSSLKNVSVVFHLAARVHMMTDKAGNSLYEQTNTEGTLHLAREAQQAHVKHFIFASSIKVNGEENPTPYCETDNPAPFDDYAVSKWKAEEGLKNLSSQGEMGITILRFPLVYGPKVKANFLRLIGIVHKKLPLPFGSIQNKRSMIFLENLVDALFVTMGKKSSYNKTFLLSDGQDLSTRELVQILGKHMRYDPFLLPIPVPVLKFAGKITGKKEIITRLCDSLSVNGKSFRKELSWEPPFTVDQGLAKTVNWYLEQKSSTLPS
jgi:nucleoside-diphosphate-sugar epimerase